MNNEELVASAISKTSDQQKDLNELKNLQPIREVLRNHYLMVEAAMETASQRKYPNISKKYMGMKPQIHAIQILFFSVLNVLMAAISWMIVVKQRWPLQQIYAEPETSILRTRSLTLQKKFFRNTVKYK